MRQQIASKILNIISEENLIKATAHGKIPVSILSDKFCEEQTFPYLLPTDKFDYNASRDISISAAQYFIQRLLSFDQCFAYVDYLTLLGQCMSSTIYIHQ